MATRTSRPGRTLLIFGLVILAMYAGAAAIGNWKPKLGLDLQGGQRIVLQAAGAGGATVAKDKLNEAADIIAARVNGAGVAESNVSTQGSNIIVVEIPGKPDEQLLRSVQATAQLRFRLVAEQIGPQTPTPSSTTGPSGSTAPPSSGATTAPPSSGSTTPTSGAGATSSSGGPASQGAPGTSSSGSGSNSNRGAAPWLLKDGSGNGSGGATTAPPTAASSPATGTAPTGTPGAGGATAPATGGPPPALVPPELENIPDPYAWIAQFKGSGTSAPTIWLERLASFDCKPDGHSPGQVDLPSQPLLACDDQGNRYLLGPSMLDGTSVSGASAQIPQGQIDYAVNVNFDGAGGRKFGEITTRIAKNSSDTQLAGSQLAIVLDGVVLSAPVNDLPITGGSAEITGSSSNPFTQETAQSLANSLKYGALPLSFTIAQSSVEGPELASNQLDAGILAGIVGLLLVVCYCLLYYRGLGLVVIASLVIAGMITYASVLLLGHAYGFTLTLPGIAGLIVAVGITADSFIVYFERLRDEVRDGRTLRTSVETGWVRARSTILAADAVSMLAALVLFIFAIGVVKGFAFALGLTTFIDVFVVFFFTKPVVTLLSRTKFYGQGHKWSGLDRQHLGMPPLTRTARTVRGEA
ncbi:MAG: preprotein translocase subunit SecD [Nocardioidaceae bacterium]|nr:preprotein translocase subunit SecD [Nocardioidaceae bacterium]